VIRYTAKTRAGCNPDKQPKTNQDSYVCISNFGKVMNFYMFGVFDGHGINGHFASDHVKKYLPSNLLDLS
jgi:serine/threonine protein phosphatase PrpC